MGDPRSDSITRWVWPANFVQPVRENASLNFGTYENLVLKDANGALVWQIGTANKSVVGSNLLPNGKLVLQDFNNKFIRQSFDHPTHTLLVDQALTFSSSRVLVSLVSDIDNPKEAEPETQNVHSSVLGLRYSINGSVSQGKYVLSRPKYNSTYSMLRLEYDEQYVFLQAGKGSSQQAAAAAAGSSSSTSSVQRLKS
ncbi:Bulb-type lectin domain containing protein [Parasponia andersonii]|uniref:Bulb-type lectin domain containing protein n=1 Tax=Parasponia andersonii TaxID=3476 RepID=A0A2P5DUM5_PARAD|nr:Bulb-type lectin domain containing protein [Parasponia andersonii]